MRFPTAPPPDSGVADGKEGPEMSRSSSIRVALSAAVMAAALTIATVAQVLAGSGNGPFPR